MLKTTQTSKELNYQTLMETLGKLIDPLEKQLQLTPNDSVLSSELDRFKTLYHQLQEKMEPGSL
ncbi:hypothetical protein [Pedobacter ginsengisoli]|uniref:hypothetical protein n=1 Tax=Pedobacter ginsengisoli TaxID=363852 RepID=UPI00254C84BC|nr:hypothetical protein [Pedobacter ginsengisoli]